MNSPNFVQPAPPRDQSTIEVGIGDVRSEINELEQRCDDLTNRLKMVLRPAGVEANQPTANGPAAVQSPLRDDLAQIAGRIQYANSRLADIMNRLEV